MNTDNLQLGIMLSLVGMSVVFLSLWLVAVVIGLLNRLFGDEPGAGAGAAEDAISPHAHPEPVSSAEPALPLTGVDGRTLAVLAAAAAVAVGKPVLLRSVRPIPSGMDGRTLAVISAAAAVAVGKPVRVGTVRQASR